MISTVVFDFDGTLVDSNAVKRQGFFELVDGHAGGRARMEAVLARVKGDRREVFADYLVDAAIEGVDAMPTVDDLVDAYSARIDASVAAAPDMPGAASLLEQLQRNQRRLYLSSATPVISLRPIVASRGWERYFDGVFGRPASKAESLRRIRDLAGGGVETIAVVGDGADDRESALGIGCTFFPVGEARGADATERVFTLPELLDVLLDRAGPSR